MGTAQAQQVLGRSDVQAGPPPEPPPWLSQNAAKVWERELPAFVAANLVQRVDSAVFGQWCEATASYVTESRRQLRNRDAQLIKYWFDRMTRIAKELGATPHSRTQITVPTEKAVDDISKLVA